MSRCTGLYVTLVGAVRVVAVDGDAAVAGRGDGGGVGLVDLDETAEGVNTRLALLSRLVGDGGAVVGKSGDDVVLGRGAVGRDEFDLAAQAIVVVRSDAVGRIRSRNVRIADGRDTANAVVGRVHQHVTSRRIVLGLDLPAKTVKVNEEVVPSIAINPL